MEDQRRTQLKQVWAWRRQDSVFSDLFKQDSLLTALGFSDPSAMPRIVSFVGGGGKTTSMYHLAEELSESGYRVLVTTSTHIQYPEHGQTAVIDHVSELFRAFKPETGKGQVLTAGTLEEIFDDAGKVIRKLTMPEGLGEQEVMERLLERFDVILIEADGSKHRPVKVPGDSEPVLIPQTGLVIACAGLHAVGHPFGEVCFRFGSRGSWLRRSVEDLVEPEDIALILMDERGSRKNLDGRYYRIILNQADEPEDVEAARQVIAALPSTLQTGCVVTSYQEEKKLKFHARLRVYYEERNFGPGVAELMQLTAQHGSIASACKEMGMAYSKAWKMVKKAEEDLGFVLMEGSRGGGNGGKTVLTQEGEQFLKRYLGFKEEAEQEIARIFDKYFE